MSHKAKSILAIIAIILLLSASYFYWAVQMVKKAKDQQIAQTVQQTSALINEVIHTANAVYDIHLDSLVNTGAVVTAFRQRDRQSLYNVVSPVHERLKRQYPYYANMHFHLPTGFSFLRMHKPTEFGDDLRILRPIIMAVHRDQNTVSGYEVGRHGLFYRVAKPVFYDSEYIGALEIGIKAEAVSEKIERILGVRTARVISDHFLNDAFRTFRQDEITTQGYSINPFKSPAFFSGILERINLKTLSASGQSIGQSNIFVFNSGELKNYQGSTIAYFLIARDIGDILKEYKDFLVSSSYLTVILGVAACFILHFSFGAYINRITHLNTTLEQRVKKRTQTLEDVTGQLETAHAELYQIFNTAADGMRVIGTDFKVLRVNDTFANIVGKRKEDLEGRLCSDDFQGEFCNSARCTLRRILDGEDYVEIHVDKEINSGEIRSFLLMATPYKSADGTILGVVENFKDITERQKVFNTLKENEQYLKTIMSTVQAGVIVTDGKTPQIHDANPYALQKMGCSRERLKHVSVRDYFSLEKPWIESVVNQGETFEKEDYILTTDQGEQLNIRLTMAQAHLKGESYLVQSFSDITDVKRLINKQLVDIDKAKAILALINPSAQRYIALPNDRRMYTHTLLLPCNVEGGDHYFIHHLKGSHRPKTIISLKDQSGHEVNCILRSIYTDLLHNWITFNHPLLSMSEVIEALNGQLCRTGFFDKDDFFTCLMLEIDDATLELTYISAGHPSFLLIRDNTVTAIPSSSQDHANLPIPFMPDARYQPSKVQLREDDQLILYSDGLTEMPFRSTGQVLQTDDLVNICQGRIDEAVKAKGQCPPVSSVMTSVLDFIAEMSGETVVPGNTASDGQNTSGDDVTLIGIEIETLSRAVSLILKPKIAKDIADFIHRLLDSIFSEKENQPYSHLKSRIGLILEEAITNAWKHGHHQSPAKPIVIRYHAANDFVFHIIDQGAGFDYNHLPDPRTADNILKPSGRGLFIIRHFSDHVQWEEKGQHIVIVLKKRDVLGDRDQNEDGLSHIRLWQ